MSPDQTVKVIAEIGVNHNGDAAMAAELVVSAAEGGADVVKFQIFRADLVAARQATLAPYQERSADGGQRDMLAALQLTPDDWVALAELAARHHVGFMATAFDAESLDLVESLAPEAHKIPSGEITNHRFLRLVAAFGRPVVMSTGMASIEEIADAVEILRACDAELTLLHCVTAYPTPFELTNLRSIPFLRERFSVPVGWSDHSVDSRSAIAATALGATVIERHVTLDRSLPGPDHAASDDPARFAAYAADVRATQAALGTFTKERSAAEAANVVAARRSWHTSRDLSKGTILVDDDVVALRPEVGVPVDRTVVGRRLVVDKAAGTPLRPEDLVDPPPDRGGSARP